MTTTEHLLSTWKLTPDSKHSIPISHQKVCLELSALCPEAPGQEALNQLRFSNLVEVDIHGDYILTPRGLFLRRQIPDIPVKSVDPQPMRTGHEWDRFRKIVKYYIECVHLQEKKQEYLNQNDLNRKYFLPVFEYGWLKPLGTHEQAQQTLLISEAQRPAMQRILARQDDDEEIYIGYPISAFCPSRNETLYTPVTLIPINILESTQTTLRIEIRYEEAEINQQWLEFAFPNKEEHNEIVNTILRLHANDDYRGLIDVALALPHLRRNNDDPRLDPETLDPILPTIETQRESRLCNAAIIFLGQPLRYSKTLKRELQYIRDCPDELLDSTSLAYIFREPVLESRPSETKQIPMQFIDSNPEQIAAAYSALNYPSSKITGPPGTGKSQVAVNIIANLIYRGKRVLFTSKNHKAVEAIQSRSESVLQVPGLSLVSFCTQDDPNPWYQQDLDLLMSGAGAKDYELANTFPVEIEAEIEHMRNIERVSSPRYELLSHYESVLRDYSSNLHAINTLIPSTTPREQMSGKEYNLLKSHINNLMDKPAFQIGQLIRWLRWIFGGKTKNKAAVAFLETNYPSFYNRTTDTQERKDRLAKLRPLYKSHLSLSKERQKIESLAREHKDDLERLEIQLKHSLDIISPKLKDALALCRCKKIDELNNDPELVSKLRNIMAFMKNANSPAFFQRLNTQEAEEAEAGFKIFSQFYPGWAVTLLSLTKASPCIPNLFDSVIIDESSQCDPASIIPALFRSQAVVFVGDSNQFPPVVTMPALRNEYLKNKYHLTDIEDQRFDFTMISAYDLSPVTPIMLREHFRCADEIADFINNVYYGNKLHIRTNTGNLNIPSFMANRHAVEWYNVVNSQRREIDTVREILKKLVDNNYNGTIGVVTPFRKLVSTMQNEFGDFVRIFGDRLLINTANGFQGGERDVIVFMLGYNEDHTHGEFWYVESPENRYIYNVAVSRAKACLFIVGDKQRCEESSVSVLRELAKIPRPKKQRVPVGTFESPWEKKLFDALQSEGIESIPQYPLLGRRLDLAVIKDNIHIDVEIDGIHFHTKSDGTRKMDDYYRDLQVGSVGWIVKRFWVYELQDDMKSCVQQIKAMIE
jgi:very-short-patch-repair endonuclease